MLASVYWRLAKEAGWTYPEVDALSLADFDGIAAQWGKEAGSVDTEETGEVDEMSSGAPREVSEEEFRRMAAAEQAFAEKHGGPRNPFL